MVDLNETVQSLIEAGRREAKAEYRANENQFQLANFETIEQVGENTFIRRGGRLIAPDRFPAKLALAGLDSILAYRRYLIGNYDMPDMLMEVSERGVDLFCSQPYGHVVYQPHLAGSVAPSNNLPLGRYLPIDEFMLMLKTGFVSDQSRADLIAIVGNIKYEAGVTVADDGVSQEAMAKTGVHFVERAKLPSDITLTRFESFPEIQEHIPPRPYFLRLKVEGDEKKVKPVAALFGVDDPSADLKIRHIIKNYLVERLIGDDQMTPTMAADMVLV